MTYFTFLALFLGIPLVIIGTVTMYDYRRSKKLPAALSAWNAGKVIFGLCLVALIYTTPWDNYLVATGVWWYNLELVTGIVFGYVPLEEYTFFILLPVLSGLWLLLWLRYLPVNPQQANNRRIRVTMTGIAGIVWLISVFILVMTFIDPAFKPATYLTLELSWALMPILIQLAFGADILLRHKNAVLVALLTSTVYLSIADAFAIRSGTWTIDPAQSLQIYIGGILPLEELVFFLLVNTLVVIGMTLVLAQESQARAIRLVEKFAVLRPLAQRMKQERST
jgi:lycopene beta-cyclase